MPLWGSWNIALGVQWLFTYCNSQGQVEGRSFHLPVASSKEAAFGGEGMLLLMPKLSRQRAGCRGFECGCRSWGREMKSLVKHVMGAEESLACMGDGRPDVSSRMETSARALWNSYRSSDALFGAIAGLGWRSAVREQSDV